MQILDWIVLGGTTLFIITYGMWRARGKEDMESYLRSGHTLPWYTISLSVISTQASAITFLSAPGQAYTDGMRFVLFYLGMPLAMVFVSAFMLPRYYRLNVITAYEFIETHFDLKTRILTTTFFLIQRSLAAGISIAAPAIVLSVILGWNTYLVNLVVGGTVIIYTVFGGSRAVSQTQQLQMVTILVGMGIAGYLVVQMMPADVGIADAMRLAGASGKLNTMDFSLDLSNRYNIWTGLLGGFFLQVAYFGTDQSQVGRYLGGSSLTQSRLGLLFNGIFKLPMQFGILFIGAMLFVFYQFEPPPIIFNSTEAAKIRQGKLAAEFAHTEALYQQVHAEKQAKAHALIIALRTHDTAHIAQARKVHAEAQRQVEQLQQQARNLLKRTDKNANTNDANYIFLTFVTKYLPAGLIGLLIAVILFAAMSTTASELNALASASIVDIFKRVIHPEGSEEYFVRMSRWLTAFWGIFALIVAQFAVQLGTLIEVVNMLGSWFYGTILGIFLLAFFSRYVKSSAVFWAGILSQFLVIAIDFGVFSWLFGWQAIAYLWFNLVGCFLTIGFAYLFTYLGMGQHEAV